MKISVLVQDEIQAFKNGKLNTGENIYFSQYENIKRINAYLADRYLERDDDAIFWNLSTPRIPLYAKNIDLDTKDLYPYAVGESSFVQNWLLKMKFYAWAKENQLAITLNDLATGIATYGSIVWKKTIEDGEVKLKECRLENLYFDQKAETVRDTAVVELHTLNTYELRAKEDSWDNVQQVIDTKKAEIKAGELPEYEIWQRVGELEEDGKIKYKNVIGYGYGDKEIILFEEEIKPEKNPYYDFHNDRYNGRWMRVGVVERLYKLQERANQLVNQNARTSEIASMLLLRTSEGEVKGNVFENAVSGQIINSTDLQQIALQNPGINDFINEMALIERQADKLCNTPDVVSGDTMPSGTPFRTVATLSNAAKSTFAFIRQRIGETLVYILLDEILPQVVRKWNREEIQEIADDEKDIEIYDKAVEQKMKIETILRGQGITPEIEQQIKTNIETQLPLVGRKLEHGKDFFNFEYKIRINPTGESYDKAQQNSVMTDAINMVLANPAVVNLPIFKQLLENNGIEWWKLTAEQMQQLQQMAQQAPQQPGQQALAQAVDTAGGQV